MVMELSRCFMTTHTSWNISIHRHDDGTFFPGTGKSEEVLNNFIIWPCLKRTGNCTKFKNLIG